MMTVQIKERHSNATSVETPILRTGLRWSVIWFCTSLRNISRSWLRVSPLLTSLTFIFLPTLPHPSCAPCGPTTPFIIPTDLDLLGHTSLSDHHLRLCFHSCPFLHVYHSDHHFHHPLSAPSFLQDHTPLGRMMAPQLNHLQQAQLMRLPRAPLMSSQQVLVGVDKCLLITLTTIMSTSRLPRSPACFITHTTVLTPSATITNIMTTMRRRSGRSI